MCLQVVKELTPFNLVSILDAVIIYDHAIVTSPFYSFFEIFFDGCDTERIHYSFKFISRENRHETRKCR